MHPYICVNIYLYVCVYVCMFSFWVLAPNGFVLAVVIQPLYISLNRVEYMLIFIAALRGSHPLAL